MRCSSAGSICHSPFSSLATEIFPALIARRIAVLFRPTAAAAIAMVYMGVLPTVLESRYGATALVKETYLRDGTSLIGTSRLKMAWERKP